MAKKFRVFKLKGWHSYGNKWVCLPPEGSPFYAATWDLAFNKAMSCIRLLERGLPI